MFNTIKTIDCSVLKKEVIKRVGENPCYGKRLLGKNMDRRSH